MSDRDDTGNQIGSTPMSDRPGDQTVLSQGIPEIELDRPDAGDVRVLPIEVLQTGQRIFMDDARISVGDDGTVTIDFREGGVLYLAPASGIAVERPAPGEYVEYPLESVSQILASPYPGADLAVDESGRLALLFSDGGQIVFTNSESYTPAVSTLAGHGGIPVGALLRSVLQLHVVRRLSARLEDEEGEEGYLDQGQFLTPYDPGELPPGLQDPPIPAGNATSAAGASAAAARSDPREEAEQEADEEPDGNSADITDPDRGLLAMDDRVVTAEDTSVTFRVLTNDTGPDGAILRIVGTDTSGLSGRLTETEPGLFTYVPGQDFIGTETFTYTVIDDSSGDTASANVIVEVTPVNDDPIALDDAVSSTGDGPVVADVLANDNDVDGDALTVTGATDGADGTTTVNPDGTITYEPAAGFFGSDSFEYTIADGAGGFDTATVAVTIDASPALIAVNDVVVDESAGRITFTVIRTGDPTSVVSVDFATADGTAETPFDYAATTGRLSFAAGEIAKTVAIDIADNEAAEPPELFLVQLSHAKGGIIIDDTGVGTILDDDIPDSDTPRLYIDDVEVAEDAGVALFTVTRHGDLATATTVDFFTRDGSARAGVDFSPTSGALTFAPGESSQTISVSISDDALTEPLEAFSVILTNAENGEIRGAAGVGIIVDNEAPDELGPLLAIDSVTVKESDGLATFTISRIGKLSDPSSVAFATADGSAIDPGDYSSTAGRIEFAAGQRTATIQVTIVDNDLFERPEEFVVTLSDARGARIVQATGAATIVDSAVPPVITGTEDVAVSEEGLSGGAPDTAGSPDTTDAASATGRITTVTFDGEPLTYSLSSPPTTVVSNGIPIVWTGAGTDTLIGRADAKEIIRVTVDDTGAFRVTLTGPVRHAHGDEIESALVLQVGVAVSDGTFTETSSFALSIEDDRPQIVETEDTNLANRPGLTVIGTIDATAGGDGFNAFDVTPLDDLGGALSFRKNFAEDGSVTLTATHQDGAVIYVLTLDAESAIYSFELTNPLPVRFVPIDFSAVAAGGQVDTLSLPVELDGDPETREAINFDGILVSAGFLTDADAVLTEDIDNNDSSEERVNPSGSGFGIFNNNINNKTIGSEVFHEGFIATLTQSVVALTFEVINPGSGVTVYWQALEDGAVVGSNFDLASQTGGTLVSGGDDVALTEIDANNTGGSGFDEIRVWLDAEGGGVKIQNFEIGALSGGEARDLAFEAILIDTDGDRSTEQFTVSLASDELPTGSSGPDILAAGASDDVLLGYAGAADLAGGDGGVHAGRGDFNVETGPTGVLVVLGENFAAETTSESDFLTEMEDVVGTRFAEVILGDGAASRLSGLDGADALHDGAGSDILVGGYGADMLSGGTERGTLVADVIDIGNPDAITDFDPSAITGDVLKLQEIFTGFDEAASDPNDFISLVDDGTDTVVRFDPGGAAAGSKFVDLVLLQNVSGLTLEDLLSDVNLDID